MTSEVFSTAKAWLEVLRLDLAEWKKSPDSCAQLQRTAARKEDEAAGSAHTGSPATPPFLFTPLVTAPVTQAVFSSEVCQELSVPSAAKGGEKQPCGPPSTVATPRLDRSGPDRPLHNPESTRRLMPITNLPKCHRDPARAGMASASHTRQRGDSSQPSSVMAGAAAAPEHPRALPSASAATKLQSKSLTPLQRLSPLAQQLYARMLERGRATGPESSTGGASQREGVAGSSSDSGGGWRRRAAAPHDAEVRRAVRDYLYRMNILSCMEATIKVTATEEDVPAFGDAVLNGTALCQLVSTLLSDGEEPSMTDDVPCRCPRTLDEVRINYAGAMAALHTTPEAAQQRIPHAAWQLLPENVYLRAAPSALLELFVHLISTYLPSPEELPAWRRHMCWQPSADTATVCPVSAAALAVMEAECGRFLHSWAVLPEPAMHRLPGPECLLPPPTAAPFMAKWTTFAARSEAPSCLCVPSIWPYVCNGVALVLLARRSGAEAAAQALHTVSGRTFFANPRTSACCLANVSLAFQCFQAVSALPSSLLFFSAESAAAVVRGDRCHIVSLLLHICALLCKEEDHRSCVEQLQGWTTSSVTAQPHRTPARPSLSSSPGSAMRTPAAAAAGADGVTPPVPQQPRETPATVAKSAHSLRSGATTGVSASASFRETHSPDTAHAAKPRWSDVAVRKAGTVRTNGSRRAASSTGQPTTRTFSSEQQEASSDELMAWLCRLVGPDFCYAAADASFVFDSKAAASTAEPCLFFSDGVLLAHLIGLLECRRCPFLDCVQPATKKAAKLFNVRRCLDFLSSSAGVVWEVPLLDEALTSGSVEGVRAVLRALHSHYAAAARRRRGSEHRRQMTQLQRRAVRATTLAKE